MRGWYAARSSAGSTRDGTCILPSCRRGSPRRTPSSASGFDEAAERLRNYVEQTGSSVMDEPATARALSDFIARGIDCGALAAAEVESGTGLDVATLTALARPRRL